MREPRFLTSEVSKVRFSKKGEVKMAKVPIEPLAQYVVAQQEEAKTKTASGLFLPENGKEKPKIANVLAVGPLVKDVKAGDRVIFGGYSTTTISVDGTDYLLIKNEDIYAKL